MPRSRGKYDVVFEVDEGIYGFNLATGTGQPAVEPFELSPARSDETVLNGDLPRIIDNLDAGMGYSRRLEAVPNGYDYCYPGYTRSPGGIFSPAGKLTPISLNWGTAGPAWIIDSIRFRDTIYLITQSGQVLVLSSDGLTATPSAQFPAPSVIRGAAVFNNRLYVGCQSGGLAYCDGASGFWAGPFPVYRSQLEVVNWRPLGVPTDMLVGISDANGWNSIRWCPITADPTVDANWSPPVRVGGDGDPRYTVMNLAAAPRHLYSLRPDGVWDMDELGTRTFNLTPWVREGANFYNGAFGLHVGDGLYYGHSQGLAFIPTTADQAQRRPEWAHPGWGKPYEGRVRGMAMCGTLHNGWGLIGQWGPDASSVTAVRRAPDRSGEATHIAHGAEAVLPTLAVQHMKVHTLSWPGGAPQLLITGANGATDVHAYWQSIPATGSPLQEMIWGGAFQPADAAALYLPADPWGRPSAIKQLLEIECVTERLNVGSDYLKVYAAADANIGAGAWVDQGTIEDAPYDNLAPTSVLSGRFIGARIDAIGHPILRSIELRAALGVQLREARTYRLVLAWDNALKGARGRETGDPEARMLVLRGLLGRICTLDDGLGPPRRARVLQVQSGERHRLGGPNRAGHGDTEGAWAIVAPVTVSFLDRPLRWDGRPDEELFDKDRVWA